jgi:hypothetical protein
MLQPSLPLWHTRRRDRGWGGSDAPHGKEVMYPAWRAVHCKARSSATLAPSYVKAKASPQAVHGVHSQPRYGK